MSSGRCTKESAIQSMPVSSAASRSERSFSVSAENGTTVSGRLTPFLSDSLPPTSTRVTMRPAPTSVAVSLILPSSSSSTWPGSAAAMISGCGRCTRLASPGARIGVEHEGLALHQHRGSAGEGPDPELRSLQVDQDADRPAVLAFDRADRRHQLAHARVRGVAHVDAEDVGAGRGTGSRSRSCRRTPGRAWRRSWSGAGVASGRCRFVNHRAFILHFARNGMTAGAWVPLPP